MGLTEEPLGGRCVISEELDERRGLAESLEGDCLTELQDLLASGGRQPAPGVEVSRKREQRPFDDMEVRACHLARWRGLVEPPELPKRTLDRHRAPEEH